MRCAVRESENNQMIRKAIAIGLWLAVSAACTKEAHAGIIPVFPGSADYYALQLQLPRFVRANPTQISYLPVRLTNTGTHDITFKEYDATNPVGGYGYDWRQPGAAVGYGGVSGAIGSSYEQGLVSDFDNGPNLSHLNNVTVAPGEELTFTAWTFVSRNSSYYRFRTWIQIAFGEPTYAGFNSDEFRVSVSRGTGDTFEVLEWQDVSVTEYMNPPPPEPAPVPEPASLAVWFVLGLAGVGFGAWRRRRKA